MLLLVNHIQLMSRVYVLKRDELKLAWISMLVEAGWLLVKLVGKSMPFSLGCEAGWPAKYFLKLDIKPSGDNSPPASHPNPKRNICWSVGVFDLQGQIFGQFASLESPKVVEDLSDMPLCILFLHLQTRVRTFSSQKRSFTHTECFSERLPESLIQKQFSKPTGSWWS